ncbi:MAG: hypothetical protein IT204_16990 [Fimbriimonadaceae bacterium]|nr:hypothetical protein [Fimbriimonadaceae bacterium]
MPLWMGPTALSLVLATGDPLPANWERLAETTAFSPRDTSEDLVYAGKFWISNAFHNGNVLIRDLWSSADGVNWTLVNDQTPYDGYSEMVVFQDKMWAIKGSVWNSSDGVTWTQVAAKTPFGVRGYGECVVWRDRIWQLGSGSDVWSTADGKEWTLVQNPAPFGSRSAAAVAVFQDKLWLCGGRTSGVNNPPEKGYKTMITYDDVWCSEDGATWQRLLQHAPWAPRHWFIAREYAGLLFIIGGHDNVNSTNFADTWATADGVTWRQVVSPTGWSPRHEPSVYVNLGSLWVVAGNAWPLMNDVWRLTLPPERNQP